MGIVVIVNNETNKEGKKELIVSHGICSETLESVILPNVHPREVGAVFDMTLGEYIIPNAHAYGSR